jgi:hypothetical protein
LRCDGGVQDSHAWLEHPWIQVGLAPLLLLVCSLGLGSGTALAVPILETVNTTQPLPGSQFQGGDGNQENGQGYIDWEGLQLDERVEHTSDPNEHDNVFHGGSKELEPGNWDLTTQTNGATPGSANVLDTYGALDRPPGGPLFVYLAFTRLESNGTVFVTFELNQNARLWTNSAGATIPCRTTGDILISYEPHGDGTSIRVDRWVTDHADPSSGCATEGDLESADLSSEVVQAAFNSESAITNFPPWLLHRDGPRAQLRRGRDQSLERRRRPG